MNERAMRAETYRRAARLMESAMVGLGGQVTPCGCCEAIAQALPRELEGADLESPLAAVFKPDADSGTYWWGGNCVCALPETRHPRILALCFMAAMVEAGDA